MTSFEAIAGAALAIANGSTDLAICGGADVALSEKIIPEMEKLGLSSGHAREPEKQCRPFDLWRTTGVAGEGACMFVLEPEESPRGGHAHIAGVGHAYDRSGAAWSSLSEALRLALGNARLRSKEIDCIYAEGLGHKTYDLAEANALRSALGKHLATVPVTSSSGAIGNALSASGAIRAGFAALALKHSMIAPTVNWFYPDPSCPLNLSSSPRQMSIGVTLVTGYELGGNVGCLLLRK
jgi:3-oxoacyl-(acyl-carrier-protein) synthase